MIDVTMVFNPPQNATTFPQMLQYINSLTDVGNGGVLGVIFLIIIGGVLFLMMRSYGVERAFGVSSLVIGIIAVFLRIYSLINDKILAICIILTVFGVYLMVKESSQFE